MILDPLGTGIRKCNSVPGWQTQIKWGLSFSTPECPRKEHGTAQQSHLQARKTETSTAETHSLRGGWVSPLSLEDFPLSRSITPQRAPSTHPAHNTSMSARTDPGGENQSEAPLTTSKTHLPKEQKHFQAPDYPENTDPGCSRHPVCSAGEQSQERAEEARPYGVCSIWN